MNDLFVSPDARGSGAADALIAACAERAREHGATSLDWQTARDNERARKVYDRVGGRMPTTAGSTTAWSSPEADLASENPQIAGKLRPAPLRTKRKECA